jgi:hypothetical protein
MTSERSGESLGGGASANVAVELTAPQATRLARSAMETASLTMGRSGAIGRPNTRQAEQRSFAFRHTRARVNFRARPGNHRSEIDENGLVQLACGRGSD